MEILTKILEKESTVGRPPLEICNKINQLVGLLELQGTPNWRFVESKTNTVSSTPKYDYSPRPDIQIYGKKPYRNDSYDSLSKHNSSPSLRKVNSYDSINNKSRTPLSTPRYISKFRNTEKQVDDKILNVIILSKLNKFCDSTYNEIRDFLYQILGSNTINDGFSNEEFIKEFMDLVFQKAAQEEIFCPLYAKLLSEISEKHPIILIEMNNLYMNYLEIFKECDDELNTDYNGFIKKNSEKKYRLGYSQFLAELTTLRILTQEKLIELFKTIFEQIEDKGVIEDKVSLIEEYINCLLKITKVLRKRTEPFFIELRNSLYPFVLEMKDKIENNKFKYKSISSKSRFLLMNIHDYLKGL